MTEQNQIGRIFTASQHQHQHWHQSDKFTNLLWKLSSITPSPGLADTDASLMRWRFIEALIVAWLLSRLSLLYESLWEISDIRYQIWILISGATSEWCSVVCETGWSPVLCCGLTERVGSTLDLLLHGPSCLTSTVLLQPPVLPLTLHHTTPHHGN